MATKLIVAVIGLLACVAVSVFAAKGLDWVAASSIVGLVAAYCIFRLYDHKNAAVAQTLPNTKLYVIIGGIALLAALAIIGKLETIIAGAITSIAAVYCGFQWQDVKWNDNHVVVPKDPNNG